MTLPAGWWDSAERIAAWSARTTRGATPWLTIADRTDAALDAILEEIESAGWPGKGLHPLFRAAARGIAHREHEARRHLAHAEFWLPVRGSSDGLAESVTDRLGVRQLVWALPADQWAVVWAAAETMLRDGTQADAAALAGLPVPVFKQRLSRARKTARALWISPGETPPGRKYSSIRPDGSATKAATARKVRARKTRRPAA